jgi:hypothetical protein
MVPIGGVLNCDWSFTVKPSSQVRRKAIQSLVPALDGPHLLDVFAIRGRLEEHPHIAASALKPHSLASALRVAGTG